MARFKKSKPEQAVEPEPATEPNDAAAQAADLADFADVADEERARVEELLAEAARDQQAADLTVNAAVVKHVADGMGEPPTKTARLLATAELDRFAYRSFLSARGLSDSNPSDREWLARVNLGLLERRRHRLEQRLSDGRQSLERREEIEDEIAALERQETEFWSFLHPPLIGSPFGADPDERVEVNPHKPMTVTRCRCGAGLSKHEGFEHGRCADCRRLLNLVHESVNTTDPER